MIIDKHNVKITHCLDLQSLNFNLNGSSLCYGGDVDMSSIWWYYNNVYPSLCSGFCRGMGYQYAMIKVGYDNYRYKGFINRIFIKYLIIHHIYW